MELNLNFIDGILLIPHHHKQEKMKRFLRFAPISLFSLTLLFAHAVSADDAQSSVANVVKQFCDSEFEGGAQDPDIRKELVYFSDTYKKKAEKIIGGLSPYFFQWQAAPLDVVDNCRIEKVSVSKDQGKAVIVYNVVARRESWGADIKQITPKNITVELHIVLNEGKWKILDPEQPRVSKKSLSSGYRGLFHLPDRWYQNASEAQLLWLRKAIDNILLLDKLN